AVTWGRSPLDLIDQLLASAGTGKRKAGLLPGLFPRPEDRTRARRATWAGRWGMDARRPQGPDRHAGIHTTNFWADPWPGSGPAAPAGAAGGTPADVRHADICKSRPAQLALWMARLSTAMAASWMASDRVGWAWQIRARSSAEPLNSMVSTPSCTSSEALGPMMCRPRTRSVSAWAITFTKPVASAMATARPTAANGKLPVLYGTPSALSCCSVLPTQAISGEV